MEDLDSENSIEKRSFFHSFPDLEKQTVEIRNGTQSTSDFNAAYNQKAASLEQVRSDQLIRGEFCSPESQSKGSDFNESSSNKKSGVRLSWKNLSVATKPKSLSLFKTICRKSKTLNEGKVLLRSLNGAAEPASLLAIMGASGAGKTTLLNVLSGQNVKGLDISGDILVNNERVQNKIKNISAYVQQEELFIGTLTVREHLLFQAYLRMPESFSVKEKEKKVDNVIAQLGLTKCQNTIIGVPGRIRGISGGENKRLSFASEIITDPKLLFVDEPTSGLDSFMAENVIICLQKIASEGTTVIATIHQPSSEVFLLFDRLLLMSEGRTAYLGKREDAFGFFERVNYPCPLNYNPADHYVHTLAIIPGKEEECKAKCEMICDSFVSDLKIPLNGYESPVMLQQKYSTQIYKVGFLKQLKATLWRSWMSARREPYISTIRIMQSFVMALIAGLVYLRVGDSESQDKVMNINGAIFFSVTTMSFGSITGSLFVFPAELPVFLKEHKLGMYRTDVYFISKTLAEFPWYFIGPVIYSLIYYFMVGLRLDTAAFFLSLVVLELLTQSALSFGYLVSAVSPTIQVATGIGPPLIMPFMLFGGFFLKDRSIPVYFIWLKWLSWFKYATECLQIIQWDEYGAIGGCSGNQTMCYHDGKSVLVTNGYSASNFNRNIGLLVALGIGFRLLAFLFVLIRAYRAK
ncbi:protein white isoform X2 [Hydra vulgaris]|uniref:protein white isoform X2 n=1 Tax=Hydra vulgaris TaxID=6087 RepID=UPI001F5F386A|nr:protein white isoform X2 [Hydra vulgaris]